MNDKNTYSVDKYLEIIAEKEGITKEEVQQEIGRAVSIALKSPDPKMQRFWTDFPCENDTPTIEEIIYHLAEKLGIQSFLGSLLFRVFRSGSSVGSFSRVWF